MLRFFLIFSASALLFLRPNAAQSQGYPATTEHPAANTLGYQLLRSWKRVEFSLTFNSTLSAPPVGILSEYSPQEVYMNQLFLIWGGGWQCRFGRVVASQELQRGIALLGDEANNSLRIESGGIIGFGIGYVIAEFGGFSLAPMVHLGALGIRLANTENNAYAQFGGGVQALYSLELLERPLAQLSDVTSMPFVSFSCSIGYAHLFAGSDFTSRNGILQAKFNIGIGIRTEYIGDNKY